MKEGRSASTVFDPAYYLNNNGDLKAAFGSKNYTAVYNHFLQYGCNEGRKSSEYYEGSYYKAQYRDLKSMNYYNLAAHYLNYGITEGRKANRSGKKPSGMSIIKPSLTYKTHVSNDGWQSMRNHIIINKSVIKITFFFIIM